MNEVERALAAIAVGGMVVVAERRFLAHMVLLTGDKLIDEAFRIDSGGDRHVLRETKRMLSTYLIATFEAKASTSAAARRPRRAR